MFKVCVCKHVYRRPSHSQLGFGVLFQTVCESKNYEGSEKVLPTFNVNCFAERVFLYRAVCKLITDCCACVFLYRAVCA